MTTFLVEGRRTVRVDADEITTRAAGEARAAADPMICEGGR